MANDIIDIIVTDNSDNVQINATPNLVSINVSNTSGNIIGSNYYLASTLGALPLVGDLTILYVINDTSLMYRWSGSAYVQINSSAVVAWGQITGTLTNQTDLQTALNLKAPLASPTFTGTVSGITKSMVGLLNVDNTSDVNKPVSSASQTALDTKAPLASPTFTGTVSGITKAMIGLGNVDNTTDLLKPISTATQSALNLKYDASNPSGFTTNVGTVTSVGGTGTVSGLSLSGSVTTSGNLTLGGTLSLTSGNVTGALGYTPENSANKGIANGYASLDGGGLVPSTQLPSYVDDVLEFANLPALPATGETGKIYVALDTNKIYRWSGTTYIEVSPTVGTIWGGITGTLSNQTDLQNALNLKYNTPTGTTAQYVAGDGSLIAFPVAGQSGTVVRLVRNTTGATLTKGTVIYISGATGNNPIVSKALATGDATSAQTFGLCQSDIANNATGYVVTMGDLIGLDTSAFTEGQQLYLSPTTAGTYTATKQYAPNHLVYIGIITRSHPTLGQIEVKIQNGYELDEIHDVSITSLANNQGLFYEASTDLWKNKSIATILGYTPANATSISGTTNKIAKFTSTTAIGDSSITDTGTLVTIANPLTLSGAVTGVGNISNYTVTASGGSATSKRISSTLVASANSDTLVGLDINPTFTNGSFTGVTQRFVSFSVAGSNKGAIKWDYTNNILELNSTGRLDLTAGSGYSIFFNANSSVFQSSLNVNRTGFASSTATQTGSYPLVFQSTLWDGASQVFFYNSFKSLASTTVNQLSRFSLFANTTSTGGGGTEYLSLFNNTGNLALQNGGTFTDAGFRLDVAGTTRFQGTTASDTAPLGSELAGVTASGTNWALAGGATNLNVGGYIHTVGSTTALTTSLAAVSGTYYQITYTITGRTAGSITIAYGGTSTAGITATGNTGPLASSTAVLTITPTTDFDGTVVLSIKSIGVSSASSTFANSSGTSNIEVRASSVTTNTFIGLRSGRRNTTGGNNSFFGLNAGANNTTGNSNVFLGSDSGLSNTTGGNNIFIGLSAGYSNTTGIWNVAIGGQQTLSNNTNGGQNIAIGFQALNNLISGSENTALGNQAASKIADGTTNLTIANTSIFIGSSTKALADNQTNQMVIGYNSTGLGSNTTVLGNSSTVTTAIYGNLLIGTTTDAGFKLDVTGTARVSGVLTLSSTISNGTYAYTLPSATGTLALTSALSGTTNYVAKFTSSSAIGNSNIFDNGTHVGIGTATLTGDYDRSLIVYGLNPSLIIQTNDNTGYAYLHFKTPSYDWSLGYDAANNFKISNGTHPSSSTKFTIASTGAATFSSSVITGGTILIPSDTSGNGGVILNYASNASGRSWKIVNDWVAFGDFAISQSTTQTGGTRDAKLYISASGNVGIGTTTDAGFKLDVNGTGRFSGNAFSNSAFIVSKNGSDTIGSGGFISLQTVTGTNYQNNIQLNANGGLDIWTYNVTDSWVKRTTFANNGAATFSSSVTATSYNATTQNIFAVDGTERIRITIGGNLLVGTTTDNGERLYVNGNIRATGTITASDLNLKKNLAIIDNPIDKLMQFNGYSYQLKENDEFQYGVIAQEVEEVLPYAVSTGTLGIKGVHYNHLIAVLIEGIKELKQEINLLKQK